MIVFWFFQPANILKIMEQTININARVVNYLLKLMISQVLEAWNAIIRRDDITFQTDLATQH